MFASEDYQKIVKKNGFELFGFNDEQTAAFIKAEVERWAAVAKSANIRIDNRACPGTSAYRFSEKDMRKRRESTSAATSHRDRNDE